MTQPLGTLEITTVAGCKNVCQGYCPQDKLIQNYQKLEPEFKFNLKSNSVPMMSFDTFKSCIDKVPKELWVDFSGYAEPFLNPQTPEMICYANSRGHKIRLYTTLVGLDRVNIDKLIGIPFLVKDYHVPDNHGLMKADVNNEYLKTLFDFSTKLGFSGAHCFGTPHQDILRFIRENGLRIWIHQRNLDNSNLITRAGNTKDTQLVQLKKTYKDGKLWCQPIRDKGGDKYNHNVLMPNGNVYLCCCDYSLKHKIGNLLTDNYDDLFVSEEYERIMEARFDPSMDLICRNCELAVEI